MEKEIEKIPVLRLTGKGVSNIEDKVAREFAVTIVLNEQELVTLLCSPTDLGYLAIGFLFSEGLLRGKGEIKKIMVDDRGGEVRVEAGTSRALHCECRFYKDGLCTNPKGAFYRQVLAPDNPACRTFEPRDEGAGLMKEGSRYRSITGRAASVYSAADMQGRAKVESRTQISTHEVFALMDEFARCSVVSKVTRGVHSAALCDTKSILVFSEDIGRHNAIDKIFGECVLKDIRADGGIVITSGRISSEILLKVAKRNIPIIISKSTPTDLGVKLASGLGITLLGFVRGKRINAYTNDWRIVRDGQ